MSWPRRVLIRSGNKVHLSTDAYFPDGRIEGTTECGRVVQKLLFSAPAARESDMYLGDDHRPVDCRRCISRFADFIEYGTRALAGDSE